MAYAVLNRLRANPATDTMIKKQLTLRLLALMAAAGSAGPLVAQTDTTPPAAPAASDEVVTLDTVQVSDVPIEQNIMPTSRPFSSVYGTDANITDIPRNVTIISREQLSAINIRDVRDFAKLTSSSYSRTPVARVQVGEVAPTSQNESEPPSGPLTESNSTRAREPSGSSALKVSSLA